MNKHEHTWNGKYACRACGLTVGALEAEVERLKAALSDLTEANKFSIEKFAERRISLLEEQVERLKAYKALADEMAEAKRSFHTYSWWTDEMLPDWLTRYDALTKETTT